MDQISQALTNCLSPQGSIRKPSEEFLLQSALVENFLPLLLQVFTSSQYGDEVKVLALILLKNIVGKSWKAGKLYIRRMQLDNSGKLERKHVLDKDKVVLRSHLLDFSTRSLNPKLELQRALIIGTIAKKDWPEAWPELFPRLMGQMDTHDELCTLVLLEVLEQLSSKRLKKDKEQFAQLANDLAPQIQSKFVGSSKARVDLAKVMQVLVVRGIGESPGLHKNAIVGEHLKDCVTNKHEGELDEVLMDTLLQCQLHHALGFLPYLEHVLQLMYDSKSRCLVGVNFLHNVLETRAYKLDRRPHVSDKLAFTHDAANILKAFFTPERVQELVQSCVLQNMPLTVQEVEEDWGLDPEGFFLTQESLASDHHIRPAAEVRDRWVLRGCFFYIVSLF